MTLLVEEEVEEEDWNLPWVDVSGRWEAVCHTCVRRDGRTWLNPRCTATAGHAVRTSAADVQLPVDVRRGRSQLLRGAARRPRQTQTRRPQLHMSRVRISQMVMGVNCVIRRILIVQKYLWLNSVSLAPARWWRR